MIQDRVIGAYFEEIELAKQPGYVSRYDDFDYEFADAPKSRPARFDKPHAQPAPMSRQMQSGGAGHAKPPHRSPHQRNDGAAESARPMPPPPTDLPKSDGFGAGIFPER